MKLIPHSLLVFFLSGFIISCNQEEKKEEPVENIAKPKDSVITTVPENMVNNYASVDISPMDMSYFPVDYPKIKMANGGKIPAPVARVIYSRPHLQRRALFNGILKYDEPWRLGANESTEVEFYRPVSIQGRKIKAGRYILYGIPHADKWTIILNNNVDTWGLKQDAAKDVARFEIPVSTNEASLEYFTIVFEKNDKGANLIIAWADLIGKLPIEF